MNSKKHILYVSRLCSPGTMDYLFATSKVKPGLQAQKFHQLLAEGLAAHTDSCTVATLSTIPVTPSSHDRRLWRLASESGGNLKYTYIPTINLPVVKNILVFMGAFFKTLCWILHGNRKNKFAICDILNLSVSSAALFACKLAHIKAVAIVTDLPNMMVTVSARHSALMHKLYGALASKLMSNYDGYILLTEQMNEVVNVRSKPYMIMEGLVDVKMAESENLLKNKAAPRIVMYAGAIYEKYGVKMLIDSFMSLPYQDVELHIFGPGEMEKDMPEYMKLDRRISYHGVVPNAEVVQKQLETTLLVNPRPTCEEFTKYSFPSKNMEYMVSGTPVVTTQLPGMPKEYNAFVYTFSEETVKGFEETLKSILAKPREELHAFGLKAKEFVLKNKTNVIQAQRVLSLSQKL
jgi:glycosyltransferase involved in cell wall biosynthesis